MITAAVSTLPSSASAQTETETAPTAPPEAPAATPPPTTPPPTTPQAAEQAPAPQEPGGEEANGRERTLKGHLFLFPTFVASSVVVSYIGLRIRLGDTVLGNLPTPAGPYDIDSVTFSEGLDLGVKITDWLAVFASGGVRSVIGTNLRALVYDGATYDISGRGGALLRVFRSDRTGSQLSVRLAGGYGAGQVATLFPLVERPVLSVAEALLGDLDDAIKTPFSSVTYDGTVAFAQGISRLFGVQASLGVGGARVAVEPYDRIRRERSTTTYHEITYTLGVAPSFDFAAYNVPVAVMPEYVIARQASTTELRGGEFDTTHRIALGAYYSGPGRKNLQLGLIPGTILGAAPLRSPEGESERPRQYTLDFILRYVW